MHTNFEYALYGYPRHFIRTPKPNDLIPPIQKIEGSDHDDDYFCLLPSYLSSDLPIKAELD